MEAIETVTYKGVEINVYYDEDPQSPNDWENDDNFLVYDHRDFCVERKGFDPSDINELICESKKLFYDGYYVFPVYAYIHSGVSLSLSGGTCQWDTSMMGFVLCRKEKGTWTREKARKRASGLIDTWNEYLSGEIYGYDSEAGSCWGFYGDEGKAEMIKEAKNEVDCWIREKAKKFLAKKKVELQHRIPLEKRTTFCMA